MDKTVSRKLFDELHKDHEQLCNSIMNLCSVAFKKPEHIKGALDFAFELAELSLNELSEYTERADEEQEAKP